MPMLISTPEDWFRSQKRDLHLIRLANTERRYTKKKYQSEQTKLHTWFAKNLPHIPIGIIGPSEYSGCILGGPCYLSADLDSLEVAICIEAWGKESFWKIETWYFYDWVKRVESVNLLSSPVPDLKIIRWWDTPTGILLLDAKTKGIFVDINCGEKILSLRDGWWRLQQLFPEFSDLAADVFPCGYFYTYADKTKTSLIVIEYSNDWLDKAVRWNSDEYSEDVQKIQCLKDAIGIPADIHPEIVNGDF